MSSSVTFRATAATATSRDEAIDDVTSMDVTVASKTASAVAMSRHVDWTHVHASAREANAGTVNSSTKAPVVRRVRGWCSRSEVAEHGRYCFVAVKLTSFCLEPGPTENLARPLMVLPFASSVPVNR